MPSERGGAQRPIALSGNFCHHAAKCIYLSNMSWLSTCQVHFFTWALYPLWLQFQNGDAHLQAVQGGSQRASVTSNWGVCSQFCPTVISSCSGNAQCTCSTCCICCLNMYCTCDTIYTYLSPAPKNLLCDIIFQLKLGVWLVLWMS